MQCREVWVGKGRFDYIYYGSQPYPSIPIGLLIDSRFFVSPSDFVLTGNGLCLYGNRRHGSDTGGLSLVHDDR